MTDSTPSGPAGPIADGLRGLLRLPSAVVAAADARCLVLAAVGLLLTRAGWSALDLGDRPGGPDRTGSARLDRPSRSRSIGRPRRWRCSGTRPSCSTGPVRVAARPAGGGCWRSTRGTPAFVPVAAEDRLVGARLGPDRRGDRPDRGRPGVGGGRGRRPGDGPPVRGESATVARRAAARDARGGRGPAGARGGGRGPADRPVGARLVPRRGGGRPVRGPALAGDPGGPAGDRPGRPAGR